MKKEKLHISNPYINNNSHSITTNTPNLAPNNTNPYFNKNKLGLNSSEVLTGLLIGAAATYVLTNENVQKTIFKGMVSVGDIISGGIDEIKERFEDAKAEHEEAKEV